MVVVVMEVVMVVVGDENSDGGSRGDGSSRDGSACDGDGRDSDGSSDKVGKEAIRVIIVVVTGVMVVIVVM